MWYEVLQPFTWVSYSGREPDQEFEEGAMVRMHPALAEPLVRDGKITPVSTRSVLRAGVIPGGRTD
jgi:hypothetical protein